MKLKHDVRVLEMVTNNAGETISNGSKFAYLMGSDWTDWERDNLAPDTRYAVLMVPIPDGHRLAKDGEEGPWLRATYVPCRDGLSKTRAGFCYDNIHKVTPENICITPIKSERDKKREALQTRLARAEAEVAEVRKDMDEL